MNLLLRGDEAELAYVVGIVGRVSNPDVAVKRLSLRCEALGLTDEAVHLLQDMSDGPSQVTHSFQCLSR